MAPRSRVGGLARLQAAITLDSLGRSQEAKELYHSLRGHPAGDIAKRAGRLLFGFQVRRILALGLQVEVGARTLACWSVANRETIGVADQ